MSRDNKIKAAAYAVACDFPDLNYSGKPINPDSELVLRIAALIDKQLGHSAMRAAAEASAYRIVNEIAVNDFREMQRLGKYDQVAAIITKHLGSAEKPAWQPDGNSVNCPACGKIVR